MVAHDFDHPIKKKKLNAVKVFFLKSLKTFTVGIGSYLQCHYPHFSWVCRCKYAPTSKYLCIHRQELSDDENDKMNMLRVKQCHKVI